MEKEFWLNAWEIGKTGFHRSEAHPNLVEFYDKLNLKKDDNILVPLCGKSLDLLWLAEKGLNVFGVELSPLAGLAFFEENKLEYKKKKTEHFTIYYTDKIQILCGDVFHLTTELVPEIHAVYDRAALIALPPDMRKRYYNQIKSLLKTEAKMFLINMVYDQSLVEGPPHSVPKEEILDHLESDYSIEVLKDAVVEIGNKRLKEAGVSEVQQKSFLLVRK